MYLGKLCEVAPERRPVPGAGAPVHERAAGVDPGARSGGRPLAGRCRRRAAVAGAAAVGLPLPPPLPAATEVCTTAEPQLRELAAGHFVACHHPVIESPVAVAVDVTATAPPGANWRVVSDRTDRPIHGQSGTVGA